MSLPRRALRCVAKSDADNARRAQDLAKVGGRLLAAEPTDPGERRLRNVVEEMALAAGVPVPKVCVLDNDAASVRSVGMEIRVGLAPTD